MRERGAERDPLLLAARELVRVRAGPVFEPDLAEELGRPPALLARRLAGEREPERDELCGRQLGCERLPVALVRVTELPAPVAIEPAAAQAAQVDARDANPSRRGPVEPGEDPEQRRLAGAARSEHGDDLAFVHREAEPLERGGRPLVRGVDAEDVLDLDSGRHAASAVGVAVCSRKAARVSRATRPSASAVKRTKPRMSTGQSGREHERRHRRGRVRAHGDRLQHGQREHRTEQEAADEPRDAAPPLRAT